VEHTSPTPGLPGLSRSRLSPSGLGCLRVVPWQGDRFTALVGPRRDGRLPRGHDVHHCLDTLRARGVCRAVTPAMSPLDSRPFLDAGFVLHERLHLLARSLTSPPPEPARPTHRGFPWHRQPVLDIDQRAFEPFWRFDELTLREARRATPSSRFRVSRDDRSSRVVGYAVTGRAGDRGYLQRLAVDPTTKGHGHGTDLVNDALTWLHRRRAQTVLVNTQERNTRALALYERLGFERLADGLVVLRWENPT
jgi:ribosomal protein S18 acetylase RimI-like enzyme